MISASAFTGPSADDVIQPKITYLRSEITRKHRHAAVEKHDLESSGNEETSYFANMGATRWVAGRSGCFDRGEAHR